MNASALKQRILPVLVAVALGGCSLAPQYERPDAPIPTSYPTVPGGAAALPKGNDAPVGASADLGWRQFFRDPRLQSLIELALVNNRDLRIAVERVEEARAQFGIVESDRYPTIGAGMSAQVQRMPEALRAGGASSDSVTRVYQAGVGMTAFELDFFGRVRNLSEAAWQQFLATAQARRTAQINIVAGVAEAYFNLRSAQKQHDLVRKTVAARQQTHDLVQSMYNAGVASALDLYQAKAQLDSVRADLEAIRRGEARARNALLLLVGEELPADLPEGAVFGRDQLVHSIPVGLPSELLERRPDIIASENALLAANANIGAARAAFFPSISITGMLGFASPELGSLFSFNKRAWSYTPQLQVPIFAGGIRGNLDLARARKHIAVAQYEQAIQTAFREVSDALAGEATYDQQLDALRALEDSAAESLRLARARYESGVDSFLQVQTSEVNLYTAQLQLLQTGLDSLTNRVELYKALGGGWFENTATEAPAGPNQENST